MRLRPGDPFDRYTIEKPLGEGGMGEVYQALDTRLHRRVALKVVRRAPNADAGGWAQAAARMMREARSAAALSHPNTVAIYDVGEHEGAPFLAMELVQGMPLRSAIGGDFPESTRLRWLLDVAHALAAAHRAGLVHRDIKPENVMLRDDGVIKVLDFGIARRVGVAQDPSAHAAEAAAPTVTAPGVLVGTPAYMAPEQLRGEALDGRADQFSWGALAYELLSGKPAFGAGRDAIGVIAAVLGEDPPPLRDVQEIIAVIVERALSKSREDRFASMDEIVEVLEPLITGEVGVPSSRRSVASLAPAPPAAVAAVRRSAAPAPGAAPGAAGGVSEQTNTATIASLQGDAAEGSNARRAGRWPFVVGLVAALGVSAGVALALRWGASSAPAPSPAASIAAPPPVPTPITDLPPPATANPQALAAYREGLQAFRDARWQAAHEAFSRAVELDPYFAAGHLRLAQTSRFFRSVTEVRQSFQRAMSLRASLGERDQALIEALVPHLLREPPDKQEAARRIEQLSQHYPGDAELVSLQISVRREAGTEPLLDLTERCVTLDPSYADCWQSHARELLRSNRHDEALDALDHCLAVSPSATDCLSERALLHERMGSCDGYERDVRQWLGQEPTAPRPYTELATALYALGRPLPTVRAALGQAFQRMKQAGGETDRLMLESQIAVLAGDLAEAERIARQAVRAVAREPSELEHRRPFMLLVQLLQEVGNDKEAAEIADRFLSSREALMRTPAHSIWYDQTPLLLKAKLRGGLLDEEGYVAARDEWIRGWEERLPASLRGALWLVGYSAPTTSPEDAREALQALPAYAPPPTPWGSFRLEPGPGKVYLLAGDAASATPHLASLVDSCSALKAPVAHTMAAYYLGMAREAQGEVAGACAAYKMVLQRWARAKASTTAASARERASALQCNM